MTTRPRESAGKPEEPVEPERVEAPELNAVRNVAQALATALKAMRIHGPTSPTATTVVDRLHERLREAFGDAAVLSVPFAVLPDALLYKGHTALDLSQGGDAAFAAMVRAGIRQFSFMDAVSRDELLEFVQLLVRVPADSEVVDLATALWERDLDQVGYVVVESFAEDLASPSFQTELSELLSRVGSDVPMDVVRAARLSEDDLRIQTDEVARPRSPLPAEDVFPERGEEDQIVAILRERDDDYAGVRLVHILLTLAAEASDPAEANMLRERLASFLEEQLAWAEFGSVDRATAQLHELLVRAPDAATQQGAAAVLERLGRSPVLARLPEVCGRDPARVRSVAPVLEHLGTPVLPTVYALARCSPQPAARVALLNVLCSLARGDPSHLVRRLSADLAEAAPLCVPVLAAIRNPTADAALVDAYKAGNSEVKRLVLRSLAGRQDAFVRSLLTVAIGSDDVPLRIMAYRHLSQFDTQGGARAVPDVLFSAAERDLAAKLSRSDYTEILAALVRLSEVRAMGVLRKLVTSSQGRSDDLLAAAARALGMIGGPIALGLVRDLQKTATSMDLTYACNVALRGGDHA